MSRRRVLTKSPKHKLKLIKEDGKRKVKNLYPLLQRRWTF